MLAVAVTTPVALAQSQTEPRLAGGAQPICSDAAIRQALAGNYAGPPCRFTEMPADLDAAPRRPLPQQTAVQPQIRPVAASARHQGNTFTASQQSSSFRTQTAGRQWPPQPAARLAATPVHQTQSRGPEQSAGEPIRLSDDFFSGGLVGGVERPFAPLYSYRGLILISADGQVRTGHAGLDHRVLQVRALDHRSVPVQQPMPRRAYPFP